MTDDIRNKFSDLFNKYKQKNYILRDINFKFDVESIFRETIVCEIKNKKKIKCKFQLIGNVASNRFVWLDANIKEKYKNEMKNNELHIFQKYYPNLENIMIRNETDKLFFLTLLNYIYHKVNHKYFVMEIKDKITKLGMYCLVQLPYNIPRKMWSQLLNV